MKKKIIQTQVAPRGLQISSLVDYQDGFEEDAKITNVLIDKTLAQVENVFTTDLQQQIASNQHFFINLPFPLAELTRTASALIFDLNDERVSLVVRLFRAAMRRFDFSEQEQAECERAANIIVRLYNPGQKISFHVDELECSNIVLGIVLANDNEQKFGLNFRRPATKNGQLECFILKEEPGMTFLMSEDARYAWQHGLPPVSARRVSITVRFFKNNVLKKWNELQKERKQSDENEIVEKNDEILEQNDDNVATHNEKILVKLILNKKQTTSSSVVVNSVVDTDQIKLFAKNKLRVNLKKIVLLRQGGVELKNADQLQKNESIFVSLGEKYAGPN